jgi:NADH-quinone oxidoreductase subunit E
MSEFDIKKPVVGLPDMNPEPQIPEEDLFFTEEELERIEGFTEKYPTNRSAVMPALWLAQEKFGFLPPEVMKLVAEALDMPYAQVYGAATFYTQYYKKQMGTYVLDVCCSFSCQACGSYDVLDYLEEKLGIHAGETTEDGRFTIQEVECLGSCGTAPMLQVTNGPYVHNLTKEKLDQLIDDLRNDKMPPFTSVTMPQDEDEMGGNRRSDVEHTETYRTPPAPKRWI